MSPTFDPAGRISATGIGLLGPLSPPDLFWFSPWRLTRELKRPWGLPAAIRPLFAAEAAPEEVLATYRDGAAAAAMRKSERGTDVFVGTPQLTPELLRTLARIAKVHLFTKVDSSVWAADGILSIHALADGPLAVHTGREGPVADAFTGAALGRGPRIVLEIRAGETRILRY